MDIKIKRFLEERFPDDNLDLYIAVREAGIFIPTVLHDNLVGYSVGYPSYVALHAAGYTSVKVTDSLVKIHEAALIIERYLETRGKDTDQIFKAFKKLQPNNTGLEYLYTLVDFIRWEASEYITSQNLPPHATIFGMGGDAQPTLNISTISSIVAAHFLKHNPVYRNYFEHIIKVGTRAITGDIGSSDIIERLEGLFPEGSGYESLVQMGFTKGYTEPVLNARRKLPEHGMIDICKIIFPPANLSRAKVGITGCSDHRYEYYIRRIAERYNDIAVIASSASGHDELMPGLSRFMFKKQGQPWISETVELEVDDQTRRYLRARTDIDSQEEASVNILRGQAPDNVLRVIAANAALFFIAELKSGDLGKFHEKLTDDIYQFLLSQRTNQVIVSAERGLSPV